MPALMPYRFRGSLEIQEHCRFECEEVEGSIHRMVRVRSEHCARCVAELLRIAPRCAFRIIDLRGLTPEPRAGVQ